MRTPAVGQSVGAGQSLELELRGGAPDPESVNPQSVRVLNSGGQVLNTTAFLQNQRLVVAPPGGGWPSGTLLLELHATLQSSSGAPLATRAAFEFVRP